MFISLPNRGLLHVEGPDRLDFLQNLITNDLKVLSGGYTLYACLLSAQGKFLHDFFIHDTGDAYIIDCEGGNRAQDLFRRLNMYRLRADVQISVEENVPVYAGFKDMPDGAFIDPRHEGMGWRAFEKPQNLEETDFSHWDTRRISLCVPDGSRDLIPNKSTLAEGQIDKLNGVSYDKGCYVGQELTARMYYRGLSKKRLYAIKRSGNQVFPAFGEAITADDQTIGEMRSSCGDIGLALLKDAELDKLTRSGFALLD